MSSDSPRIQLHLGAEQTLVTWLQDDQRVERHLALGSLRTAREHFQHTPPSALELEMAIQTVEDEIMPLWKQLPEGGELHCTDGLLRELALLSERSTATQLSLEEVEALFNRLTARSLGRPVSQDAMRSGADLAAALLILRELMHHLQFDAVHLDL